MPASGVSSTSFFKAIHVLRSQRLASFGDKLDNVSTMVLKVIQCLAYGMTLAPAHGEAYSAS